ncbi:MAG: hypothetical protein K2O41_00555 [Clostridia bacterium]|nr:hypothetical protein [Clostridia bacterium]
MSEAAEKLNIKFSVISDELFGKSDTRFLKNGKRFTATKILSAGFLCTRAAVLGSGCTTSYSDFEQEFGFARSTIARNVDELTSGGTVKRCGQSKYETGYTMDMKHGVPVYHFLFSETFNGEKLTDNGVLYLSILIRHYTNDNREQKYFIGGEKRAAKTLNVPQSTAFGIVRGLMKAGVIHRFVLHDNTLSAGVGINNDYKTVYVVDDKILNKVKAIRKEQRKQKANAEAVKEIFGTPTATSSKRRGNLIEQWQSTLEHRQSNAEKYAETLARTFKSDFEFNRLKREYVKLNDNYWSAILRNGGRDTPETLEQERQLDGILSDILNYLLSHNVKRTYIPDDWKDFIIEILKS